MRTRSKYFRDKYLFAIYKGDEFVDVYDNIYEMAEKMKKNLSNVWSTVSNVLNKKYKTFYEYDLHLIDISKDSYFEKGVVV